MISFNDLCDKVGKTPQDVREIIKGKFRFVPVSDGSGMLGYTIEKVDESSEVAE